MGAPIPGASGASRLGRRPDQARSLWFGGAAAPRRGTVSRISTGRLSSLPTTTVISIRRLLLTSIPEPWRHQVLVGAAADYFFTDTFDFCVVVAGDRRHTD